MDELNGAGVALITPFNADGTIDFGGLEKLIDHQIKGGMDYLVSLGTTGETATLSETERKSVWDFTARHAAGRIPLVAGIGGNNTAEIAHQLTTFDTTGYTAILSVSPYYNKPTQEGIYQHYKALSAVTPLPLIIYNIPGRTGSNISPETTVKLARDFDNIIATKDASGSFDQFSRIMRDKPKEFLLISGDDPMTLPMMALGAAGIISVVANAFPREIAELARLCSAGDYASARVMHNKLIRITELCFVEGNPAGIKNILTQLGICGGTVRLPLVEVSDATKKAIISELELLR
ncbi:4-hydroxy-tetrahydrodipicolinate synthase [Parapedobacter lycopersici]|uniref:4-hydroxy-tetrahydrodipicolinate synthase n=1 Tax=Parapedobacter lycopersici TaxID=1864939 RepID=UPI003342075F